MELILGVLILYLLIIYLNKCYFSYIKKKNVKDELLVQRIKFLRQKQYNYYYSLAINSPELLSNSLADRDIERFKDKKIVLKMYSKAKNKFC